MGQRQGSFLRNRPLLDDVLVVAVLVVVLLLVLMIMFIMLVEVMSKSAHILADGYGGYCSFSYGSGYFVIDSNLYEKISYVNMP